MSSCCWALIEICLYLLAQLSHFLSQCKIQIPKQMLAGYSAWWTARKSLLFVWVFLVGCSPSSPHPVMHWIKPKFPNIFFCAVMTMLYLQHFLITAAGIYGSSWMIFNGSARYNWEKQVCCTDSSRCCSGLLSSAGKHLRVSNWECFKIAPS